MADKQEINQRLRDLTKKASRSNAARLREVFDEVEAAREAGVKRTDIYNTLKEMGFDFSLRSFDDAVYRLRKERVGKVPAKASAHPAKISVKTKTKSDDSRPKPTPASIRQTLHKEIDLDEYL